MTTPAAEPLQQESPDFSIVLGGPLFQLWRQARLSGDALELLRRRMMVMALLAWLPLLVLAIAEGHAWGWSVKLPFLRDIEMHARLLLAMPLLIFAELFVHGRMRVLVRQFTDRGLVPEEARGNSTRRCACEIPLQRRC
jgi:hypothetical protein